MGFGARLYHGWLVVFFIIIACAGSTSTSGRNKDITTAKDAALALEPLGGKILHDTFLLLGLLNASLAASVLPLSVAYYVCEGLGFSAARGG